MDNNTATSWLSVSEEMKIPMAMHAMPISSILRNKPRTMPPAAE